MAKISKSEFADAHSEALAKEILDLKHRFKNDDKLKDDSDFFATVSMIVIESNSRVSVRMMKELFDKED